MMMYWTEVFSAQDHHLSCLTPLNGVKQHLDEHGMKQGLKGIEQNHMGITKKRNRAESYEKEVLVDRIVANLLDSEDARWLYTVRCYGYAGSTGKEAGHICRSSSPLDTGKSRIVRPRLQNRYQTSRHPTSLEPGTKRGTTKHYIVKFVVIFTDIECSDSHIDTNLQRLEPRSNSVCTESVACWLEYGKVSLITSRTSPPPHVYSC